MTFKIKTIGYAIPAPAPHKGWLARVERYPSGRKLPEPRILVDVDDHGIARPFATPHKALDALNQWAASPLSVARIASPDDLPAPPVARSPRKERHVTDVHALDHEGEHAAPRRKARKVTRVLPEITKMRTDAPRKAVPSRDKGQLGIEALIASGAITVTRCVPGARQSDSRLNTLSAK